MALCPADLYLPLAVHEAAQQRAEPESQTATSGPLFGTRLARALKRMAHARLLLSHLAVVFFAVSAHAQPGAKEPPQELRHFILPGTKYLAHAEADLNGDGLMDYVLVVERQKAKPADPDIEEGQRPLMIVVRQLNGALILKKMNGKIVYCETCGGIFGDPFEGVTAAKNSFTVNHYGGSAWRWSFKYAFNYSRRDDTWQLVRVTEISHHTSDPNKQKVKSFRPPKDFGKIDIADFDPDKFKNTGQR